MKHIKAPDRSYEPHSGMSVFFAGSIEMGAAEPWQEELAQKLSGFSDDELIVYNPRRPDWDSSWTQDPAEGTQFYDQVTWELDHIDKADLVVFYFDPNTKSPITLLELGTCLAKQKSVLVYCPEEYFRHGNVYLTCQHYDQQWQVYKNKREFFNVVHSWIDIDIQYHRNDPVRKVMKVLKEACNNIDTASVLYTAEMFDEGDPILESARESVMANGGTLAYNAETVRAIREALKILEEIK